MTDVVTSRLNSALCSGSLKAICYLISFDEPKLFILYFKNVFAILYPSFMDV